MSTQKITRVLILGGGFGGVTTAQELSKLFKRDRSVEITLVNRDNYFVFVPLLASAAAGSIEPLHVVVPIRRLIPRVQFRAEEVIGIDPEQQLVTTGSLTTGRERQLPYDHLVIALGNVISLSKLPGVTQHGKTIKTLGDALAIRNHVLQMLEAADIETDPVTRREMLTFVVAGGGFSGVEMVGEINDLVREVIKHYPSIAKEHIKVILLHSNQRILPEMSEGIADYALKELRKRGVEVWLNVRLAGATPHEAVLQGGIKIPTRTLIVAVGNAPPPVLEALKVKKERGKIVVDEFMRVPDQPNVWALGDNAIVPNRASTRSEPSPPTAQYALRQGKTLAYNIAAALRGQPPKPFAFGGLGLLCLIGHGAGVGELLLGIKLTGFLGWFMWRNVYWSKIPSFGRKVQVGLDWLLDLFLPRELAQVNLVRTQTVGRAHYEANEYIFRQFDPADHFYMIAEGEVEVIRERLTGEHLVLKRLGKGDYFGETALLMRRPRNASVRCVTPVDVITLSRDDFSTLSSTWLQLATNLREVSEQRLAESPLLTWAPGLGLAQAPEAAPGSEFAAAAPPSVAHLIRRDSGGEIALDRDLIGIGRSPDNHIVIANPNASRRHALIQREGSIFVIEDLGGPNGTWLNERRLTERTPLKGDDVIRIGETEFTFREPQAGEVAPVAVPPRAARLIRAGTGEEIALDRDLIGLGRSSENQVVVADPTVSRRHALIQREGETYWIEDLGGSNGTWVNGRRLTERVALTNGDVIRIGDITEFAFQFVDEAVSGPAAPAARAERAEPMPKPAAPAQPEPSLTGIIQSLDASKPAPAPAQPKPASLSGIIQSLDASKPAPVPAAQPEPTIVGSMPGFEVSKPATPPAVEPAPREPTPHMPEPTIVGSMPGFEMPKPATPPTAEPAPREPTPPVPEPSLTGIIQGLDVPKPATPLAVEPTAKPAQREPTSHVPEPASLTGIIQGLEASKPERVGQPAAAEGATVVHKEQLALYALLQASAGPAQGTTFEVSEAGATLGRSRDNPIPILDEELSRRHARIEFKDGDYWLTDLGSTNGTFVNQTRLSAPHRLQSGDVIELGTTRLNVTIEAKPVG